MAPVLALSGRRISAAGAEQRFPLARVPAVSRALRELMVELNPAALVCSAASGADLIALEVAGQLGVRRRIVLPFAAENFRETSVIDSPGAWGPIYDGVIADVHAAGDLVVLAQTAEGDAAYAAAAEAILDQAVALAGPPSAAVAVLVWEGARKGEGDITALFGDSARRRHMEIREVPTLETPAGA